MNNESQKSAHSPKAGQPFRPYRLFHGVFIPEALLSYEGISPGAKLAFGRLSRYAGENGDAFPAIATLGTQLGVKARQARNYVRELEAAGLLRRDPKPGKTNSFVFLWHEVFASEVPRTDPSAHPGKILPPTPAISCRQRESIKRVREEKSSREALRVTEQARAPEQKARPDQTPPAQPENAEREAVKRAIGEFGLGEPDDALIGQTLRAGNGASGFQVAGFLYWKLKTIQKKRHLAPRGFGWFPEVVTNDLPGYLAGPKDLEQVTRERLEAALRLEMPAAAREPPASRPPGHAEGFSGARNVARGAWKPG